MNKEKFVERLNKQAHSLKDIIKLLYDYITNKEKGQKRKCFEWLLDNVSVMDLNTNGWESLANELAEILDSKNTSVALATQVVSGLVKKQVSRKEFYDELWEKFNDDILLASDEAKESFLISLWLDSRIPYYELAGGIEMPDDEYAERKNKLADKISKAAFITSVKMDQKTKRASLLIREAAAIEDEKDLAVYWAVVLSMVEAQSEARAVQRLKLSEAFKE